MKFHIEVKNKIAAVLLCLLMLCVLKISTTAFVIGLIVLFIVGIAWPYRTYKRDNKCAYCGLPVPDDGYICPCLPKYVPPDPIDDTDLYLEWCNGPGKNYARHAERLSEVEGAPKRLVMVMDHGWDKAFYKWVAERNTKPETRNYPFPAPPIPDALYSTEELIIKYNLKIIKYYDACEPKVNCTMYCALPPGKHFDHWPKSGGITGAVKFAVEQLQAEAQAEAAAAAKVYVPGHWE